jgi:hypothetical protein
MQRPDVVLVSDFRLPVSFLVTSILPYVKDLTSQLLPVPLLDFGQYDRHSGGSQHYRNHGSQY